MFARAIRWKRFIIVALCLGLLVAALGIMPATAAPFPSPYLNGFENPGDATPNPSTLDPDTMFGVTRVASGTAGISSADGAWHATAPTDLTAGGSIFTRLGGYQSVFPAGGFTTSIDIYLDMTVSDPGEDSRLDWSSAISNTAGGHRRDFIFSIGTNGTGGFVMSASNNSPGWPANPARDPFTITTTGWYTYQSVFRNNAGVLAVDDDGHALGVGHIAHIASAIGWKREARPHLLRPRPQDHVLALGRGPVRVGRIERAKTALGPNPLPRVRIFRPYLHLGPVE